MYYYSEKCRELVTSSVTAEFLELAKNLKKLRQERRGYYEIEWYTSDNGFYIKFHNQFRGTFAIGKKTHEEQQIFNTKKEAQIQGCKEFLEWYKQKFNSL